MTLTSEIRLDYEDFMEIVSFMYKQGCLDGSNAVFDSVDVSFFQRQAFADRWPDILNQHVEKVEMNVRGILITNGIVEDLT